MFQDLTSLVLDIGTSRTRLGYGGDDAPKLIQPSYVSRNLSSSEESAAFSIGAKNLQWEESEIDSIFARKGQEGIAFDYHRVEPYLTHLLKNQLNVNLPDYSLLVAQDAAAKPHQLRQMRQKLSEFMFQSLDVANVFFLKEPVLACFATGRSTALVLDSGDTFTRSVAVYDGFCLTKSAKCVAYGGKDISQDVKNYVQKKIGSKLLTKYHLNGRQHHQSFLDYHLNELLSDIKESLSPKHSQEPAVQSSAPIEYELPDRRTITLSRKQMNPTYISCEGEMKNGYLFRGIPAMITDNINSCDVDIKKQLYNNVLMTGGSVLNGGFVQDVISKISEFSPPNIKVKPVSVCAPGERKYLPWIGGSIVTSLSSFQSYWVGKQEWKENGPNIVEKKCT